MSLIVCMFVFQPVMEVRCGLTVDHACKPAKII